MLGPGYGLLGLPGGYDNGGDWDVVKTSLGMARDYEWWGGAVVICDWGCAMMSCIDCSDGEFPVYRYDGSAVDHSESDDEPPGDAWCIEADTFAEWLLTPNCNANATGQTDGHEPE